MKKALFFALLSWKACPAWAVSTQPVATGSVLSALWLTALLTAVVHTIAGPDHYLPFIAIAKSRGYSLRKTLFWTFVCGLGHIGSALLIALGFIYFSHWLSEAQFGWIEDNRADMAAWVRLICCGLCVTVGCTNITNTLTSRTTNKISRCGFCLLSLCWDRAKLCCRF